MIFNLCNNKNNVSYKNENHKRRMMPIIVTVISASFKKLNAHQNQSCKIISPTSLRLMCKISAFLRQNFCLVVKTATYKDISQFFLLRFKCNFDFSSRQ